MMIYIYKTMCNTVAHHPLTDAKTVSKQQLSWPTPFIFMVFFFVCLFFTWCHKTWNIPLDSLDQLSWFCPLTEKVVMH